MYSHRRSNAKLQTPSPAGPFPLKQKLLFSHIASTYKDFHDHIPNSGAEVILGIKAPEGLFLSSQEPNEVLIYIATP
jgi:hypothetical protein